MSFNPPRSAGSGESNSSTVSASVVLFQSAPERGLRGISCPPIPAPRRQCFNPPRSAGSGESLHDDARPAVEVVSIRPGARAPGNHFASITLDAINKFQSAPERGAPGNPTRARTRRRGCCFNPPRSAGSGESTPPDGWDRNNFVSIRPGARAPGNRPIHPTRDGNICFNPPRSAGSGESQPTPACTATIRVSIRPGARAPGNRTIGDGLTGAGKFQSAPERGLRGIIDRHMDHSE